MQSVTTHGEDETRELGSTFARGLRRGDLVALYGDLGSGKTRFVQGICRGLGVQEHVASPTFTIVNEYPAAGLMIYHFDFYRIESLKEIRDIGFEEYAGGRAICLIEWAEKAQELLPDGRYDVQMKLGRSQDTREITITHVVGEAA